MVQLRLSRRLITPVSYTHLLIDEVWQGETEFVDAHALTVAVKRLRDKLEDDTQKPEYIKTVYGIGYTWAVNG